MTNKETLRSMIEDLNSNGGAPQEQLNTILLTSIANSLAEIADALIDENDKIQEPKWIKCSDHLPDLDIDVLGTTKEYGDVVKLARQKSYLEPCGWEWVLTDDIEGNTYESDEIIAWMPLPEGFKEDK